MSRWWRILQFHRFFFFNGKKPKNGTSGVLCGNVEAWPRRDVPAETEHEGLLLAGSEAKSRKKKQKNLWREHISEGSLDEIWTFTAEQ